MQTTRSNKHEKPEEYILLGNIVKGVISENGVKILENTDSFIEALRDKGVTQVIALQLGLLLEAGNIKNYIMQVKTGITMIDVNNMVTCAETETGLSKKTIKHLLTVMLYGLSLPTAIQSVRIPTTKGFAFNDGALLETHKYKNELETFREAVNTGDSELIAEKSADIELLVKAGLPEAYYLKGICYLKGIATEKDDILGYRYMTAAAKAGVAEANAYLGDWYFENATFKDYNKAFAYYTQLGAVALSKDRRDKLKIVVAAKRQNVTQIVLNGILLCLIFVFNQLLGNGTFSLDGSTNWGWAITSDVLVALVYGLQIAYFVKTKYNNTKWAAVGMIAITMLTALLAL